MVGGLFSRFGRYADDVVGQATRSADVNVSKYAPRLKASDLPPRTNSSHIQTARSNNVP